MVSLISRESVLNLVWAPVLIYCPTVPCRVQITRVTSTNTAVSTRANATMPTGSMGSNSLAFLIA